jgi:lysophospholipase L1-like esterase
MAGIGAATLCTIAKAEQSPGNPSGVGGYNYRLPSFKTGSRLLFQGDSITDMNWGREQNDRNHYLGHSYVYLICARLGVDMPEAQLDINTRGISGNKVADLCKRWKTDAVDMKPDLLSILIGVNDVGGGTTPDAFESDYRHILDASRKANSELRLVLLDPFVSKDHSKTYRAAIDKLGGIVAELAKDYNAVHIKTQAIFDAASKGVPPEHWIWDRVHPLPQGHELIARNWLQEVSARWPKA